MNYALSTRKWILSVSSHSHLNVYFQGIVLDSEKRKLFTWLLNLMNGILTALLTGLPLAFIMRWILRSTDVSVCLT